MCFNNFISKVIRSCLLSLPLLKRWSDSSLNWYCLSNQCGVLGLILQWFSLQFINCGLILYDITWYYIDNIGWLVSILKSILLEKSTIATLVSRKTTRDKLCFYNIKLDCSLNFFWRLELFFLSIFITYFIDLSFELRKSWF